MGRYAALGAVILLSAAAQILLKRGVARLVLDQGFAGMARSIHLGLVGGGVALLAAPPLYFYALAELDLGVSYAATALTQGVVALAARVFLRERLTPRHLAGVLLIVAGLCAWGL